MIKSRFFTCTRPTASNGLICNLMIVAYKRNEYRNIFSTFSFAALAGADALESRLRHPGANVLRQLQQRLRGTWGVTSMELVNAGLSWRPAKKDTTAVAVERESCISKRDIAREMGLSQTSVLEVLLDDRLDLYNLLRNATCFQTMVLYTHYMCDYDVAVSNYPLSYRVPVRERYGSTLLRATREQHDQNCTQSH